MKYHEFEGMSAREIREQLQNECYDCEEDVRYFRPFDESEMNEIQDLYLEITRKKQKLEDELEKLSAPIKEQLKTTKSEFARLSRSLTDEGEITTGDVYLFIDRENRQMHRVDPDGNLIDSRPLTVKERQLHIQETFKETK